MKTFHYIALPVTIVAACFFASPAVSDEQNALDYMPHDNFTAGWMATGDPMLASPRTIRYLLDNQLLLMEYDPLWFAGQSYSSYQGEMTIDIVQFNSASDAFGYYQMPPGDSIAPYLTDPETEFDTIRKINNTYYDGYRDRFYFKIYGEDKDWTNTLLDVAIYLYGRLPGTPTPADMVSLLPPDDLVRGTERYIRGPLGLSLVMNESDDRLARSLDSHGVEVGPSLAVGGNGDILDFKDYSYKAVAGEYRVSEGRYYLLLIAEYDDPETAGIVVDKMQEHFQNGNWRTVIVEPLRSGLHPQAFSKGKYIAFWADGSRVWLLWDLDNQRRLLEAIGQNDR